MPNVLSLFACTLTHPFACPALELPLLLALELGRRLCRLGPAGINTPSQCNGSQPLGWLKYRALEGRGGGGTNGAARGRALALERFQLAD